MQVKIREVVKSNSRASVFGLTVPTEIAIFFSQTFFRVEKSGNAIIFTSGANQIPTKEEVKKFNFQDCKI